VTGPLGGLGDVGDELGEVLSEFEEPVVLCRSLRFRKASIA
jgi:hypothetical protein